MTRLLRPNPPKRYPLLQLPTSAITPTASSANGSFPVSHVNDGIWYIDGTGNGWVSGTTNNGISEWVQLQFNRNYNQTIVAIGDSITAGHPLHDPVSSTYGAADVQSSSWGQHLLRMLPSGWSFINKGVGGNTTSQMLSRFSTDVIANNPAYCLILGGVNDISAATANTTILSNLQSMYSQCFQNGIIPIACTLTPWNAGTTAQQTQLTQLNQSITQYAMQNQIPLIDYYSMLNDPTNNGFMPSALVSADNIHPTPLGYYRMSQAIDPNLFTAYQYVRAVQISTYVNGNLAHLNIPTQVQIDFGTLSFQATLSNNTTVANKYGSITIVDLPNIYVPSNTMKITILQGTPAPGATAPYYTGFGEVQLLF